VKVQNFTIASMLIFGGTLACKTSEFKGQAKNIPPTVTKEFVQDEFPIVEQSFVQGTRGEIEDETFKQGEWGELDLLVVVDNSKSMAQEQANLANKLEPLLSKVEKSDWQIAVVTTDPSDKCRPDIIKKSDANAKSQFASAINKGINGSGNEKGIAQAVHGLKPDCFLSPNWLREKSTVAVLIISDEDNCSIDDAGAYGCAGEPGEKSEYLTDYLATIRKLGEEARVYGLIWHPSEDQSECSTGLVKGYEYAKAIELSQGTWGSICDSDYTNTLQKISEDVAQILELEHALVYDPEVDSLKVLVDGKLWDKYELDGKIVKFTEPPPFGSNVEFAYRYGREGKILNEFRVEKQPAGEVVEVSVDSKSRTDGYVWSESEKKLVFDEAPEDEAKIVIKYKEKTALKKEFQIGTEVKAGTVVASINGEKTNAFKYDAASGNVIFTQAPAELAKINISFVKPRPL